MEILLKVKYFPAASLKEFENLFKEKAEEQGGFTTIERIEYSPDKKRTDITTVDEDKMENTEYGTLIVSLSDSTKMSERDVVQIFNTMEDFHSLEVIGSETK
ncbi:MAG: hypothetical protein EA344_00470 [Alkalicoccus sp.]|nr:MAG: hypothetical protein EA344_00470 [Alkalicoccus sp.]